MPSIDPLAAFDLTGRVAIVTGASSGLGARFARVLAAAGARVVVTARRADRLDDLVADMDGATAVATDITAHDAASIIMGTALDRYGRVDILVNNAGIVNVESALDLDPARFRHEIEVDLVAPYTMARAFAAHVIEQAGTGVIVNLGSILGTVAGRKLRLAGLRRRQGRTAQPYPGAGQPMGPQIHPRQRAGAGVVRNGDERPCLGRRGLLRFRDRLPDGPGRP